MQGLLPLFAVLVSNYEQLSKHITLPFYSPLDEAASPSTISPESRSQHGSHRLLAALTVSASAVLAIYSTSPTFVLGISSAMSAAIGLVFFGEAVTGAKDDNPGGSRGLVSANGTFSRRGSTVGTRNEQRVAALRDVAAAMTLMCGLATCLMEPTTSHVSWQPGHYHQTIQRILWTIVANVVSNILVFLIVSACSTPSLVLIRINLMCSDCLYASLFVNVSFTLKPCSCADSSLGLILPMGVFSPATFANGLA